MSTILGEVRRIRTVLEGLGPSGMPGGPTFDLALLRDNLLKCTSDPDRERVLIRGGVGGGTARIAYAVGPALTHLVPLQGGALFNFSVACSQIITNGTGMFQGVHGLKKPLGATRAGPDLIDPAKNVPFEATTIDTFRIVWPNGVPKGFNL